MRPPTDDPIARLRSVCIQNGQDPSIYPVVTPRDGWHWRMANQCVQVADANHHESHAHLGRTHFVMEVATLAMKRELGPTHPVAVLLEPHTATTMKDIHMQRRSQGFFQPTRKTSRAMIQVRVHGPERGPL